MTNDTLTQSPADSSLALHLLSMALGVAQTAVLCTAAQLGLADQVKDGPKSVAALAEATGTHLPTLTRLMSVLVHLEKGTFYFSLAKRVWTGIDGSMPRTARASVGNICYHVINRGNAKSEYSIRTVITGPLSS